MAQEDAGGDSGRAAWGARGLRESFFAALALMAGCADAPDPPTNLRARVEVRPKQEAVEKSPQPRAPLPRVREPPEGFVSLSEAVPGVVLEVRYATANNFTGAPLPGYVVGVLWVHRGTARALAGVQAALVQSGLRLRVFDAYRPARASEAMVAWAQASGREELLRQGYVARRSNHARGNTLDVTLETATGEPIDMGTAWDSFSLDSHYAAARGEAMANRRTLRRAMVRAGFQPYAREWWHFTLPVPAGLPRLDVSYELSQTEPR